MFFETDRPLPPGTTITLRALGFEDSAKPRLRDFAVPALMVAEKQVHFRVSFDVNPTSRQMPEKQAHLGLFEKLIRSRARIHQAGCGGCIGMGQAPATGKISLRTVPRNFPGRSGTKEDQVYLCSPEISKYAFSRLDDSFISGRCAAGDRVLYSLPVKNPGQGSSREHAAIEPRYLGLKAVFAKSFARIHWQNLINFGVLPLTLVSPADYNRIAQADELEISNIHQSIDQTARKQVSNRTRNESYPTLHALSKRQIEMIKQGSLINAVRRRKNRS